MSYYYLQQDGYSCGAVAVLNLLKIFGQDYGGKDLKYLKDVLMTSKNTGTNSRDVINFIRLCGLKVQRDYEFNGSDIYLVLYPTSNDECHYIVINGADVINYWNKKNDIYITITRNSERLNNLFRENYGCTIWRVK